MQEAAVEQVEMLRGDSTIPLVLEVDLHELLGGCELLRRHDGRPDGVHQAVAQLLGQLVLGLVADLLVDLFPPDVGVVGEDLLDSAVAEGLLWMKDAAAAGGRSPSRRTAWPGRVARARRSGGMLCTVEP